MKKSKGKYIVAIVGLIVAVCGGAYLCRDVIIESVLNRNIVGLEKKYDVSISYSSAKVSGLSALTLNDVLVRKVGSGDTLIYIGKVCGTISKRSLTSKHVRLKTLDGERIRLYGDLSREAKEEEGASIFDSSPNKKRKSIAAMVEYALGFASRMLPPDVMLKDIVVDGRKDSVHCRVEMPEFQFCHGNFGANFVFMEDSLPNQNLRATGHYDNKNNVLSCRLACQDTAKVSIPLIERKYGMRVEADTVGFDLLARIHPGREDDMASVEVIGLFKTDSLGVRHDRLSRQTLSLGSPSIDLHSYFRRNSVEIDSGTVVRLGKLRFSPYILLEKDTSTRVEVRLDKERFDAMELFGSIPKGLLPSIDGMETAGTIDYHFLLKFDTGKLDSLEYSVNMKKYPDFKIKKFGAVDFTKIRDTFVYAAYDGDKHVRDIMVSGSNPQFVALENIPKVLRNAVLYSEDPSFMRHRGFLESAIRESLIKNLKERRFARGGSTISMQLVKNIFLSREKRIMRKVEEAMIVWLIENNGLVSKERMLEIYMNVIEWGPNVYGAREAARFHFGKEPKDLTAAEAIYLAMIIPRPKKYMYAFEGERLRSCYEPYFGKLLGRMIRDSVISRADSANYLVDKVRLTGAARGLLKGNVGRGTEDVFAEDSMGEE